MAAPRFTMTMNATRGLILAVRRWQPRAEPGAPDVGPALLRPGRDLAGEAGGCEDRGWGTCRWCRRPCDARRHWHKPCVLAYLVARGATGNNVYLKRGPCDARGCNARWSGAFMELDHRLALGIAARRSRRVWLRAWHVSNLQWLCHTCHGAKTAEDIRIIRQLDRELDSPNATLFGTYTDTLPRSIPL